MTFSFIGYSVFNDAGEWCGVVCFDRGAIHTAVPFGMVTGQVVELVRVALNGKQPTTSQAVSMAVRCLIKDAPLVQVLVSFADQQEGHVGTIYQAMNWTYLGERASNPRWRNPADPPGVFIHCRAVTPSGLVRDYETGKMISCHKQKDLQKIIVPPKHKYAYPLNKSARKLLAGMTIPYPKKPTPTPAPEAQTDERPDTIGEAGGSIPTPALTYSLP